MVFLDNWSLTVQMSIGGDYVAPFGTMNGHRKYDGAQAIPGTFKSFDRFSRTATSMSGTKYTFGNFVPNGNAKTEAEAFDWIAQNWMG